MVAALLLTVGWTLAGSSLNGVPTAQRVHADTLEVAQRMDADTLEVAEDVSEQALQEMIDLGEASIDDAASGELASAQERLHELAAWKLDVNRAGEEALQTVPGMTQQDAARIVSYRKKHGRFRRLSELRRAGLSAETMDSILPFLTINERIAVKMEVVQRWSRRITTIEGHRRDTTLSRYLGSPDALMTRFKLRIGSRVTLGGTLEKDAGEPMSRASLGHDFAAGYGVVSDLGPLHRIILGDHAANVGEGLSLGQSPRMGSGPRSWRVRETLRPHSSTREYGYFRGLAVQTKPWYGLRAALAVSRKRIDARLDSASGAWSFASSGLHRTLTERSRSRNALESVLGWILSYGGSRMGATVAGSTTKRVVHRQTVARHHNVSGYFRWSSARTDLAAEVAFRDSAFALSVGLTIEPTRSTQFWLQGLYSPPGGAAPHSSVAVDSRGLAQRESQWLAGVTLRPSPKIGWSLSFRSLVKPSHPIEGTAFYVRSTLESKPHPWLAVRLRIVDQRNEPLDACTVDRRVLRCATDAGRRSLRLQIEYQHSRALRHRFQIEVSRSTTAADEARRHGMLLYKDVRWRPLPLVQIDGRMVFFEVTDFAARIYAFENDVLYSFSAPVFSGRGRRSYVILRFAPHKSLTLQVKYGVSLYEDVRSVGSGLDATDEPRRKDVRVQLRWRIGLARPPASVPSHVRGANSPPSVADSNALQMRLA